MWHLSPVGIRRRHGCASNDTATQARDGSRMFAVATFDTMFDMPDAIITETATRKPRLASLKLRSCWATQLLRPDCGAVRVRVIGWG